MYHNIGTRTKNLAGIMGVLAIIIGVIGFIAGLVSKQTVLGIICLLSGAVGFVSTWMMYCVGETNEKVDELLWNIEKAQGLWYLEKTQGSGAKPVLQDVPAGGWRCTCGRGNPAYVSTCVCGKRKQDVENP